MKLIILLSLISASSFHPIMMLTSLILLTLFLSLTFYFIYQFSIMSMMMILIILGGMLIVFMYMISLCPNKKITFNSKVFFIFLLMAMIIPNKMFMLKLELININKIYLANFVNMVILMMIFLIIMLMIVSKNLNWINAPIKKSV
nr:NADH dehydrogenase subunit 6 [Rhipicephalus maculatus]